MLMLTAKVTGNPIKKGYKTVFEEDFSRWQGVYVAQVLYLQDTSVLFDQCKCSANEIQVSCKWRIRHLILAGVFRSNNKSFIHSSLLSKEFRHFIESLLIESYRAMLSLRYRNKLLQSSFCI